LFADIFERDVLSFIQREWVTISVISTIGEAEPMLKSHLLICLNLGVVPEQLKEFTEIINNDLDTPQALAFIWDMLKKEISDSTKYALLLEADKIFDLGFNNIKEDDIPQEIIDIANQRLDYRAKKDWAMSDKLRDQAKTKGYLIEDTTESFKISKI